MNNVQYAFGAKSSLCMIDITTLPSVSQEPASYEDFFGSPSLARSARSPWASHLLASYICTKLTYCLKSITGADRMHNSHGTKLSILLALELCQQCCRTIGGETLPCHLHRCC